MGEYLCPLEGLRGLLRIHPPIFSLWSSVKLSPCHSPTSYGKPHTLLENLLKTQEVQLLTHLPPRLSSSVVPSGELSYVFSLQPSLQANCECKRFCSRSGTKQRLTPWPQEACCLQTVGSPGIQPLPSLCKTVPPISASPAGSLAATILTTGWRRPLTSQLWVCCC